MLYISIYKHNVFENQKKTKTMSKMIKWFYLNFRIQISSDVSVHSYNFEPLCIIYVFRLLSLQISSHIYYTCSLKGVLSLKYTVPQKYAKNRQYLESSSDVIMHLENNCNKVQTIIRSQMFMVIGCVVFENLRAKKL